jgi:hypothetical protein
MFVSRKLPKNLRRRQSDCSDDETEELDTRRHATATSRVPSVKDEHSQRDVKSEARSSVKSEASTSSSNSKHERKRDKTSPKQHEHSDKESRRDTHRRKHSERATDVERNEQHSSADRAGKMKYMQKYYHKGAFFMDKEENVLKRNFAEPTLEDHFDKSVLPKVLQVVTLILYLSVLKTSNLR